MRRLQFGVLAALAALVLAFGVSARGAVAASPGGLALSVGSATQTTSTPFDVTVSITRADQEWAVYNVQVAYDSSVLQVKSVTRLPIADCTDANWANPQTTPTVLIACVFQASTATGPIDTITFQCLKDGSSVLHLVTLAEDSIQGSTLSDFNADAIPTDLTDGPTIKCGAGGPVETVAIPTNPSQGDVQTAIAGSAIPAPTGAATAPSGTPGLIETSIAQGTPFVPTSPANGTAGAGTPPAGAQGTQAAAATATAAKASTISAPARTSTALAAGSGKSDSGGSSNTGLIIVIVIIIVAIAGGGGYQLWRRQQAGR